MNTNASQGFTINNKVLASACLEVNTGYLELSERQSWLSEELADVKKKQELHKGERWPWSNTCFSNLLMINTSDALSDSIPFHHG